MKSIKWIHDIIDEAINEEGFVGNITINVFKGGCSNIVKTQSVLPPGKEVDKGKN